MKDNFGTYAVFIEQGSSASKMTAAKVLDVISRLPGCSGQASATVSAYTNVIIEDAPNFIKNFRRSEVPHIVDSSASVSARTVGQNFKNPILPLKQNSYEHSSAD